MYGLNKNDIAYISGCGDKDEDAPAVPFIYLTSYSEDRDRKLFSASAAADNLLNIDILV